MARKPKTPASTANVAPTMMAGVDITPAGSGVSIADIEALLAEEMLDGDADEINIAPEDDIDLDSLLAIDVGDEPIVEPETIEEPEVDHTQVDESELEAAVSAVEADEQRQGLYNEQESVGEMHLDEQKVAPAPAAPKKAKKEPTPRMTLDALPAEAFILEVKDVDGDLVANKAAVITTCRGLAKKIIEKAENVILSVAAGKQPSVYTVATLKALRAAGSLSSKDVKQVMFDKGHTPGTASAQSQQMMTLLPALKIATKTGSTLVLNPDSVLAQALFSIIDTPIS